VSESLRDEIDAIGLSAVADRLMALADTAELMGDDACARRLRNQAELAGLRAMHLLD
jgi:hypothetical protein